MTKKKYLKWVLIGFAALLIGVLITYIIKPNWFQKKSNVDDIPLDPQDEGKPITGGTTTTVTTGGTGNPPVIGGGVVVPQTTDADWLKKFVLSVDNGSVNTDELIYQNPNIYKDAVKALQIQIGAKPYDGLLGGITANALAQYGIQLPVSFACANAKLGNKAITSNRLVCSQTTTTNTTTGTTTGTNTTTTTGSVDGGVTGGMYGGIFASITAERGNEIRTLIDDFSYALCIKSSRFYNLFCAKDWGKAVASMNEMKSQTEALYFMTQFSIMNQNWQPSLSFADIMQRMIYDNEGRYYALLNNKNYW